MFCCFEELAGRDDYAAYPGDRRYTKTGGNALAASAPQERPPSNAVGLVIAVIIPEGVRAGQTICVTCPDGSRAMNVIVPAGMIPGQMFTVTFPPENAFSQETLQMDPVQPPEGGLPAFGQALDTWLTPTPDHMDSPASPVYAQAIPVGTINKPRSVTPPSVTPAPRQFVTPVPPPQTYQQDYTPRVVPIPQQAVPAMASPVRQTTGRQTLMLVQVPPGCPAGTTLHVSVPNEPGRILAAMVPNGNVSEFHVSYEARGAQQQQQRQQRGILPPGNAYQQYPVQHQHQQQHAHDGNTPNPMNRNGNSTNGGMMLPFIGGAAIGAATAMTVGHFAHNNNNSNGTTETGGDWDDSGAGGAWDGGVGDWDAGGFDF